GRSYIIVKAEAIYSSGSTWLTVSRNTTKKGPAIWERDGRTMGGVRPRVLRNLTPSEWNGAHRTASLQENDSLLKVRFHATPADGDGSTWEAREDLYFDEAQASRKITVILISFLVSDIETGGSGVPFQILLDDVSRLMTLKFQFVSDIPDLNFATEL